MNLFKIRNFVVAVIVGSVGQMSFYALNVLWPTHITNLYTTDNLTIGWMSVWINIILTYSAPLQTQKELLTILDLESAPPARLSLLEKSSSVAFASEGHISSCR